MLNLAADDLVVETDLLLDQGKFQGRAAVRAYREALREVWGESVRSHPEELTEHGDHVVVIARTSVRGKSSGVAVDTRVAHLWTIRGGKVAGLHTFRARADALEAAGLRE